MHDKISWDENIKQAVESISFNGLSCIAKKHLYSSSGTVLKR